MSAVTTSRRTIGKNCWKDKYYYLTPTLRDRSLSNMPPSPKLPPTHVSVIRSLRAESTTIVSKHKHINNNQSRLLLSTTTNNGDAEKEGSIEQELEEEPRESMAFDVLIVGGGPAGLAASIRIKQLCIEHDKELSVCVIDKGSEIGAHILSGNVFDPKAIEELFPQWAGSTSTHDDNSLHWTEVFYNSQQSYATPVDKDNFQVLTEGGSAFSIPSVFLPSQLHNEGNYILSLSQLCRWLAEEAESLGVEIYPGTFMRFVCIDFMLIR